MRNDMKRKLIESPRWGSWMPNHSVLRDRAQLRHARADDSFDRFARRGAMRPHHGVRKDLTDKLNPLIRFLRKSRGRLWDEVYSELRALLSPRSVIDMHILQHLDQFVLLHVRVTDALDEARITFDEQERILGVDVCDQQGRER